MTGRDIKVSVIVTTYNHERYIDRAIESVLEQATDFDYELVVGEDCSTDRTRDIVAEWQRKRPDRIRLVLQEKNVGGHGNFSAVYRAAAGDYVSWLEGDDYFTDPRRLQKMADFLDAHAECALCYHPLEVGILLGEIGLFVEVVCTYSNQHPVLPRKCKETFIK